MLALNELKTLILEPSSNCQAKCPFCSRLQKRRPYGGDNISLDDFRKLPEALFRTLRQVSLAGNFGDFCANADMLPEVERMRELNADLLVCGDTNGSLQDEAWWAALGRAVGRRGYVVFALDGLADTHAVHRKGTDFLKTLANARAYAAAGGLAVWKFIVFRHNEHQLEEAEAVARDNGFARFYAIPSRFYNEELHPPRNVGVTMRNDLLAESGREAIERGDTALCKPIRRGSIYIGADGTVLPCCFAHVQYYTGYKPEFAFMDRLLDKYGQKINFKVTPFEDILASPFFAEAFTLSRHNPFCLTKCNGSALRIKKDIVVREATFAEDFPG